MTAIGTVLAVLFTPLNFAFWGGGLYSTTSPLLRPIEIDPLEMFRTVFIILGLPVIAGMVFAQKFPPKITKKNYPATEAYFSRGFWSIYRVGVS